MLDDHAQPGVRQHRSRSAARSMHRDRATGCLVAQPVRRLPLLGGHVGIRLAGGDRLRSLTTIGTPVAGFTLKEKVTKAWPLVGMYRLTGPNDFIVKQLMDSLVGGESI